ncbi:MAG: CinA family protein [Alphaproteobacteria bacterium]|nr:CinA family protein [Alphaproteobacteria bacterium]
MFPPPLLLLAESLLDRCRQAGLRIATAESCTGGLVSGLLTAIPGSSDVVERGFITYTNLAKQEMLGVPASLFPHPGAVSEEVAIAMARGALACSRADISVAVTGIAGPGGATAQKPAGLVHIAAASRNGEILHEARHFSGNREAVRLQSVESALQFLTELVK